MKRAIYSAEKIGHFGLAKEYYAHFTSPIRRYPDLVLHRQLADFLDGKGGKMPQGYLMATAQLATEREQIADDASRQLIEIKKFRFLQQQLDEKMPIEYRAVVAKCTNYGVFIDIPDLAMGGLIHISNLSNQYVRFNSSSETLNAGGETYRIGMVLQVQVAKVDFNQRRADFMLVGGPKAVEAGTSKSTSGEEKSRKGRSREESPSRGSKERPARDAGQRPSRDERPSRDSGQRPSREERPARGSNERPARDAGQRPSREERPAHGSNERPARDSGQRPSRDSGQRPPRDEKKAAPSTFRKFERKKR
jgi:ribonuclease R